MSLPLNPDTARLVNARWMDEPEGEAHGALTSVVRQIRNNQRWRLDADEYHAELYAGGPGAAGIKSFDDAAQYLPAKLPYNVCRGATDTLTAKVSQHRPLPQVLTTRGNYTQQKRAKKMSQFIEGMFYKAKIFEKQAKAIIRDAGIFGRGMLKCVVDGKDIVAERAHVWELFTDSWDARYGDPRNIYQVRTVDRGVLLTRYAKERTRGAKGEKGYKKGTAEADEIAEAIRGAGTIDDNVILHDIVDATVDRVHVVEAWHLPSGPDAGDGRHVVAISTVTLLDEPWERDYFPFAMLGYSDPVAGYWPQGLVEQLEGFQYEINTMSEKVSESHRMTPGCIVAMPTNSGVPDTHVVNGVGTLLRHNPGAPPVFFNPDPVSPQTYQRLRDLPQDALADVGISQMSAQSQKPQGIDSGIGLQTMDDIETERFVVFGRNYEAWCLEVARNFVDCAREIAKKHGDYAVPVIMKGGILDLSWKDVKLDGFELKVFSTSILPTQPAARLDRLKGLFDSQLIDRSVFLRELDAPELSAELDLETADKINVDERLELMLDADDPTDPTVYRRPNNFLDLAWAARRAQAKLNKAEVDGAPDGNLDLLRKFATECEQLIIGKAPPPPAPMPQPAGMMPPPGAPMPGGPQMPPPQPQPPMPLGVAA